MKTYEGNYVASNKDIKIGIVAARFNEFITSKLLGGALDALRRHDVPEENIETAWVPGAFEIPLIASRMAKSGRNDAGFKSFHALFYQEMHMIMIKK